MAKQPKRLSDDKVRELISRQKYQARIRVESSTRKMCSDTADALDELLDLRKVVSNLTQPGLVKRICDEKAGRVVGGESERETT